MREFKFKTWHPETKRMSSKPYTWEMVMRFGVKEFIPLQYIESKDKNGKEIYEGDIVKATKIGDESVVFIMKVEWEINSPCGVYPYLSYHFKTNDGMVINMLERRYYVEVIGNIFENPELIK